jgi:probable rRNA maturation factor
VLEVDVLGRADGAPGRERVGVLCSLAAASHGVQDGHVAVEFVDEHRIAELNAAFRDKAGPTDVLSFPIDGAAAPHGPRELGDIVICPARTDSLEEAIVHGMLHLLGMDHEADDGEMLALQGALLAQAREQ